MHPAQRRIGASLAVASLIALWGCGGGPSATSSMTEAQVTGTVKIRGKPMNTGEITFNPTNSARKDVTTRTAPIKPDGTYEMSTLVGRNLVKITGPEILKEPELGYAGIHFDVQPGSNTLNIELPPAETPGKE